MQTTETEDLKDAVVSAWHSLNDVENIVREWSPNVRFDVGYTVAVALSRLRAITGMEQPPEQSDAIQIGKQPE